MKMYSLVHSVRFLQLSCLLLIVFSGLVIHSYSQFVVSHSTLVRLVKTREQRILSLPPLRDNNITSRDNDISADKIEDVLIDKETERDIVTESSRDGTTVDYSVVFDGYPYTTESVELEEGEEGEEREEGEEEEEEGEEEEERREEKGEDRDALLVSERLLNETAVSAAVSAAVSEGTRNHSNSNCSLSHSSFTSWQRGIVTQIGPHLKRNCTLLRQNPSKEIKTSKLSSQLKAWKSMKPWEAFAMRYKTMKCEEMRKEFEDNFYVSQVEKEFPIAYIFVVYTNAGQVLRLLKSIYRPHNLYCIHPDARQGRGFKLFFEAVAKCLDNVFVVSKPVRVYYGHISITEAQLHCMNDLEQYPVARWRYVINLCGREIPIKTNREIVQSLIKLKGYSSVSVYPLSKGYRAKRFSYKFKLYANGTNRLTDEKQVQPPGGINLYKSMNFIAASRNFVKFLLHDHLSIKFYEYLHTVYAPEEHYYSSLYGLYRAKGAKPPKGLLRWYDRPIVDGFIWLSTTFQKHHVTQFCPGAKVVHCICILSAADLGEIERLGVNSRRPVFFFNKYFLEWDPTPMDCMEERLVQNNMNEFRRDCLLQSSLH